MAIGRFGAFACALLVVATLSSCDRTAGNGNDDHFARARDFAAKGNFPSTIVEAKNALQKNPDNVDARMLLGHASVQVGDGREAEIALKRAKELGADDSAVIVDLGKALLLQGENRRVLLEILASPPYGDAVNARIHAIRGEAALELGRFAEAAQSFKLSLGLEHDLGDALLGQARIAIVGRRYDEAEGLLKQVLDRTPDNIGGLLVRADLYRAVGKPDDAMALYQAILGQHPGELTSHVNLASMEMVKGQFDEAAKHIAAVSKVPGASVMAQYLAALLEYRKQNYAGVRDPIQKVLAVAPQHLPSLLLAGTTEYALNSNEQAEKYMRQAIAVAPNVLLARKVLVATLLRTGQVPQALAMVRAAVEQAPDDPAVMALAGETYSRAGDYANASKAFARATALDPKNADARMRLGMSRLGAGDTDRAIADLEAVVQLDPQDSKADAVVVVAYMNRKQYAEAGKAVALLERKQPNSPIVYNLKGGVLLATKDLQGARAAFEKSLSLDPTYVPAAINLARIDLNDHKPQVAKQRFEAILAKDPGNAEAAVALVATAQLTGTPQSEINAILERAVQANPKSVKPLLLLSQSLITYDPKAALEKATAAAAISPTDLDVLDALGLAQLANGQTSGALATFTRQAEAYPNSALAQFHLATVLNLNGNPAGAMRAIRKSLDLRPDYLEAQAALAGLELNAGNVKEALQLARKAQTSAPTSPIGYLLEGDAQMVAKAYLKAAASYEKAYGFLKNGGVAVKIHAAYSAAGNQGAANARLLAWLKESPNDTGARYYLAGSALKNRDTGLAIEQYEAIAAKDPKNAIVLNDLAFAYEQAKDPRAIATAERAYTIMPGEGPIADTFGWMLTQQGNAPRGLQVLREAARAMPDSTEIRMHLVQALLKTGDKDGARRELERLVALRENFSQRSEAEKLLAGLQADS